MNSLCKYRVTKALVIGELNPRSYLEIDTSKPFCMLSIGIKAEQDDPSLPSRTHPFSLLFQALYTQSIGVFI